MQLVESNLFTRAKLARKTKTIKKIFSAKSKDKVATMISLPQMPILFLKKKKKISFRLNALIVREKVITLPSVLKKKFKKLVLVLEIFIPVTIIKEEAPRNIETGEIGKNSKNSNVISLSYDLVM